MNSGLVTERPDIFQLVAKAQRRNLRAAFQISLIPSMVEPRGLPCASRYTVFIAQHIIYALMFAHPRAGIT